MKDKVIGWKIYEVIGHASINPIIFVYDILKQNKKDGTVNENNIRDIITLCFDKVPHRKSKVLDLVEEYFPEYKEKINAYRVLL